jgi:hypothetical protein
MRRRLAVLGLAVLLSVGCAASFQLFDGEPKDTERLGLALTALRGTCSLHECEALLVQTGIDDDDARRSCAIAWLADQSPCKEEK